MHEAPARAPRVRLPALRHDRICGPRRHRVRRRRRPAHAVVRAAVAVAVALTRGVVAGRDLRRPRARRIDHAGTAGTGSATGRPAAPGTAPRRIGPLVRAQRQRCEATVAATRRARAPRRQRRPCYGAAFSHRRNALFSRCGRCGRCRRRGSGVVFRRRPALALRRRHLAARRQRAAALPEHGCRRAACRRLEPAGASWPDAGAPAHFRRQPVLRQPARTRTRRTWQRHAGARRGATAAVNRRRRARAADAGAWCRRHRDRPGPH